MAQADYDRSDKYFNPSYQAAWIDENALLIYADDNKESISEQFLECEKQYLEHPYYEPWGSMIHYVCARYVGASQASLPRRPECSQQTKLRWSTTLSDRQWRQQKGDPDYRPQTRSQSRNEILAPSTLQSGTRRPIRQNQPPASSSTAGPPDSTVSKSDMEKEQVIYRVADGMVSLREVLKKNRTNGLSIGVGTSTRVPALIYEIKVPPTPKDLTGNYAVSFLDATRAIGGAWGQIVQQAQFTFHMYRALSVVWAAGVCGRYIRFFRFLRSETPAVDHTKLTSSESYFANPPGKRLRVFESDLICAFDDNDGYSEDFQRYIHLALATASRQFTDEYPPSTGTVTKRNNELIENILTLSQRDVATSDEE